ncbi:MAG: type II toxin-antitoxin system RelE/ParE family toxin [Blastocatellia bacterium]|nr:type II toxin-antitoxin system RelE/ParE family toxin [Blastocatellia bacterium]
MSKISIEYTGEFKRNIRQLAKKYRRIKTDLQELLDELVKGHKPGDQIKGVNEEVFKARVRNTDSAKGKSGGYRVIYQYKNEQIILITIYSKSEQQVAPH